MRSNYTQINSPGSRMLSDGQIREVYEAALEVMERQGSIIAHEEAKDVLLKAGAMEGDKGKILIPAGMVEKAIETAPKFVKLYGRDGQETMHLGGYHSFFGMICDATDVMDPYTQQRRPCRRKDWSDAAKITDYLPHMQFMHICGSAEDMDPHEAYRQIAYDTIPNCRATIGLCMGDKQAVEEAIDLAEIVAGGKEAFRRKPNVFCMAVPVTPLQHEEDSLSKVLLCADRNVPVTYFGMQMEGVTAPASGAGDLVISVAESLTGLVVHQMRKPGAPFIFGGMPSMMDLKTLVYSYGAPEFTRNLMGMTDIAHYLDLPNIGTTCSDAKRVDAQCGTEFALSTLAAMLSGQNLVHDPALMDQASLLSLEAAVLNDEIIGMCKVIMGGIDVNREELAVDVIGKVGAGGNFLAQKHTTKRFPGFWMPTVFDRSVDWQRVKPLEERLNDKVKEILENHVVPSLPQEKLDAIAALRMKWDKKREEAGKE